MNTYNPDRTIDPLEWDTLDEQERLYLVERYHRKKHIKMPNSRMHAVIHVIVENQVALSARIPVQKTLERLMLEGLHRHDAVHAIGSVLSGRMFELMKHGAKKDQDVNEIYHRQLEELTAEGWLRSANEESEEDDLE